MVVPPFNLLLGLAGEQIHRPSVIRARCPAASLYFIGVVMVAGHY